MIVYRVGGAPATLPPWATSADANIEFHAAVFSNADAVRLAEAISADSDTLADAGIALSSWGPSSEGDSFEVGVEGDPVSAKAALLVKYPELAGKIVVEQEHVAAGSRTNDTAPYYGGDRILTYDGVPGSGGSLSCSGGIPAKNSHGTYMITAAHCNCNTGSQWDDTDVETGNYHKMGGFSHAVDRGWDMAYVYSHTANIVFTDTISNPYYAGGIAYVTSYAHPHAGEQVCVDGSFAKLRCGAKVKGWKYIALGSCAGTHRVAEWYADQNSGLALAGYGDSGGGVFVLNASNQSASARGIFSAFNPSMACPDNHSRTCGSRVYFPDIVNALHKHGFQVNF